MSVAEEPLDLLADYRREPRGYDEAVDEQGRARACHVGALRALAGHDLEALAGTVDEQVAGEGVCFHSAVGDEAFLIDPVPRVLDADEWALIEAGLCQRVRALNAFIADVYAERRIVDEGVVPERVIDTAEYHEPAMNGVRPPGDIWIGISGLDLVRDAHGNFQVLEDNVRTPSGYSYAAAARRALAAQLDVPPADAPRPLDELPSAAAASRSRPPRPPPGRNRDRAAHRRCATTPPTTSTSGPPRRSASRWSSRTSSPRATTSTSSTAARTPTGSTPRSAGCCSSRCATAASRVVNAFGTGVADDKLTHAYVEDMIRFYLDEEPLLPSVETFDLGRPEILERAMDVLRRARHQAARRLRRAGRRDPPARRAVGRRGGARGGARSARRRSWRSAW